MIPHDLVTQVANHLKVNVYQLFAQASDFEKIELPAIAARADYETFIQDGSIPLYVIDYCELIISSMEE